jgi:DNA-binding response OmpR family regulator
MTATDDIDGSCSAKIQSQGGTEPIQVGVYPDAMTTILVVTDEVWVRNEVHAGLTDPGFTLIDHTDPTTAAETAKSAGADAVIVDLQIGSMGGMAVTRAIRHATSSGDDKGTPVVMLLDRSADAFLAGRAGADGWLAKPFTSHQLMTELGPLVAATDESVGG